MSGGLYKSRDGGKTWKRTLGNDKWTGVTDLVIHPENPEILFAATWDRHRTVASYMGGGPELAIHRSSDGGETWENLVRVFQRKQWEKSGLRYPP